MRFIDSSRFLIIYYFSIFMPPLHVMWQEALCFRPWFGTSDPFVKRATCITGSGDASTSGPFWKSFGQSRVDWSHWTKATRGIGCGDWVFTSTPGNFLNIFHWMLYFGAFYFTYLMFIDIRHFIPERIRLVVEEIGRLSPEPCMALPLSMVVYSDVSLCCLYATSWLVCASFCQ